jgi:tripartite-type tricarboxylate transporter receptor subunit TctC
MTLRILALLATLIGLGPMALPAHAAWPERPIKLIVPFPPGGPNDVVARLVAEPLAQQLGQPVVVDNRAGAGGTIGSEAGAKAAPDGYTLTLGSTSSHSLPTLLGQKIGYSPTTSFAPVGLIGRTPTVLLASTRVAATDFAGFIQLARAQPGRLNYGSSGNGTLNHLVTEYFKAQTGLFLVHIPYRGTGQAVADLIAGQIDLMFDAAITAQPQVKAGKLRALAVSGAARLPDLPQVPTFEELGLKDFQGNLWIGLLAPAGTPAAVLQRLNDELQAALRRPEVRARMAALGFEPLPSPAGALSAHMQAVQDAWARVIRERRITTD